MVFLCLLCYTLLQNNISSSNRLCADVTGLSRAKLSNEKKTKTSVRAERRDRGLRFEESEYWMLLSYLSVLSMRVGRIFFHFHSIRAAHSKRDVQKLWIEATAFSRLQLIGSLAPMTTLNLSPRARHIQSHRRDFAQLFSAQKLFTHFAVWCVFLPCTDEIWRTYGLIII